MATVQRKGCPLYKHIFLSGSTAVKTSPGFVDYVSLNAAGVAATVGIFDTLATGSLHSGSAGCVGIYNVLVTNPAPVPIPVYSMFDNGIVLSCSVDFDTTVTYR